VTPINIQFTRFSAFYSPLISVMSGGFLEDEGFEGRHTVAAPGASAIDALLDGSAHVVQSAVSYSFADLEAGRVPPARHFAQINEMDGFFLVGRAAEPDFTWERLAGRRVLVDHGEQPLAMFRYACHRMGLDYGSIDAVDAGAVADMDTAFRAGEGDYVHQQGPAPQQLEADRIGHVVASVGAAIGPCAFSSLAATPEWLETGMARAFVRAYHHARQYVNVTPPEDIAAAQAEYFPNIDRAVLTAAVSAYQKLGCWAPGVAITRSSFDVALDVFVHSGDVTKRHDFDAVVAPPPH
jgi:NitT/TauT family transport system substrate-binding protein